MAEQAGPAPVEVTVRLFAGARAAAGVPETALEVPAGGTVAAVLDALRSRHPGVGAVLPTCSFLLDGVSTRPERPVGTARSLDVLPPFSGG